MERLMFSLLKVLLVTLLLLLLVVVVLVRMNHTSRSRWRPRSTSRGGSSRCDCMRQCVLLVLVCLVRRRDDRSDLRVISGHRWSCTRGRVMLLVLRMRGRKVEVLVLVLFFEPALLVFRQRFLKTQ